MAASAPPRPRSSALPLAWVWFGVIVYASLFPFEGWRWPGSAGFSSLLKLPWPRVFIPFDVVSNLLGYLPLGLLIALARLRMGSPAWQAVALAVLWGGLSAYGLEVLQHWLPPRVPSLLDGLLNAAGALLGALLALLAHASGLLRRWQQLRERWLREGNGAAMALLVVWPLALLFPGPVPLGLGQVASGLQDLAVAVLTGVPGAEPLTRWLAEASPAAGSLSRQGQFLAVMFGLQAPCLLAFTVSRPGWGRVWLAAGALGVGVAATTLSTVLNFGPAHAMAWASSATLAALGVGWLATLLAARAGQRLALGLALMVLTGLVVLVNRAPADPYLADSLQAWEQGRFIRFHGVAQWLGWAWPYAAIAWLLARLAGGAQRD